MIHLQSINCNIKGCIYTVLFKLMCIKLYHLYTVKVYISIKTIYFGMHDIYHIQFKHVAHCPYTGCPGVYSNTGLLGCMSVCTCV